MENTLTLHGLKILCELNIMLERVSAVKSSQGYSIAIKMNGIDLFIVNDFSMRKSHFRAMSDVRYALESAGFEGLLTISNGQPLHPNVLNIKGFKLKRKYKVHYNFVSLHLINKLISLKAKPDFVKIEAFPNHEYKVDFIFNGKSIPFSNLNGIVSKKELENLKRYMPYNWVIKSFNPQVILLTK